MKTEHEIKSQVTPEIIKKMVELAEGFEIEDTPEYNSHFIITFSESWYSVDGLFKNKNIAVFSTLLHRAVEGWNKKSIRSHIDIFIIIDLVALKIIRPDKKDEYIYYLDYQPSTLTACECALLDCLCEVLK